MKIKLRKCPLCGHVASISECRRGTDNSNDSFYISFRIRCIGCGLMSKQYTHSFKAIDGEVVTIEDGYKTAAEEWNRRADEKEVKTEEEHGFNITLPFKIGDMVFVYANNRAEETKVKAYKVYDDRILVYTTIGEFDAKHVYEDIVELYANECRETSFE